MEKPVVMTIIVYEQEMDNLLNDIETNINTLLTFCVKLTA